VLRLNGFDQAAAAASPSPDRPQTLRRHPVLVVDDGGAHSIEIERLLTAMRVTWEACAPGAGTLEAVRRDAACLITPFGNSKDGARSLIEAVHRVAPGLAVIVVLDNPDVAATVAAMRSGAHAVIEGGALATGLLHQVAPLLQSS
jgi:DNA-binding NtrC family response regulator